jgi:hypothetical protein
MALRDEQGQGEGAPPSGDAAASPRAAPSPARRPRLTEDQKKAARRLRDQRRREREQLQQGAPSGDDEQPRPEVKEPAREPAVRDADHFAELLAAADAAVTVAAFSLAGKPGGVVLADVAASLGWRDPSKPMVVDVERLSISAAPSARAMRGAHLSYDGLRDAGLFDLPVPTELTPELRLVLGLGMLCGPALLVVGKHAWQWAMKPARGTPPKSEPAPAPEPKVSDNGAAPGGAPGHLSVVPPAAQGAAS